MPVIRSLLIAFSTYSRIPVPQVEWNEENRRYSMCFFPLVGLVTGLLVWGWLSLCACLKMGPFLQGAVAALLPLLIKKRLEILKDSHTGAFAVMGCAGYLLLSAALYSEADPAAGLRLAGVFVLSRALSAFALVRMRNARNRGMLDDISRVAEKRLVTLSSGVYALLCLVLWLATGVRTALLCVLAAVLCYLYYQHMSYKQFGGVTGDLAGWFLQVTELVLTAVIVIGGKLL